jgi:hypothetical protein
VPQLAVDSDLVETPGPIDASDVVELASATLPVRPRPFSSGARVLARGIRRHSGVLISVVAALLALGGAAALGPVDRSNAILLGLGFDPDRAQLITALVFGGTTALVACLSGGVRWAATALGLGAAAALFGSTFTLETGNAMAASGATGAFDALGWAQTLVAFVVMAVLTAWACATCALPLRRELAVGVTATVEAARRRPFDRGLWGRPVATLLTISLLAAFMPVAGDVFNFGSGPLMIAGGSPRKGLMPDDQGLPVASFPAIEIPTDTPSPIPSEVPSARPSASGSLVPSPTATSPARPWEQSPPTGQGRVVYVALKEPWTGGIVGQEVAIYLPAGYDESDSTRYPVVYEAPSLFSLWNSAIHVQATLDSLISDGEIPPSLFVFMNGGGGPYADSECADSFDGSEKMDHFLGVTVPAYIDSHYRTVARPAGRAIMGMSQGGYCSTILAFHHPDVYGAAISFSGYFEAGIGAASARYVFGNNLDVVNNASPSYVVYGLDAAAKSSLYLVIVAQSSQQLYGDDATAFVEILDGQGIANSFIDASEPHGWPQVRDYFARALVLIARREAALGVFDQPAASPSP